MIALKRGQAFLLGFFIIFSFYAADKIIFICKARVTEGEIMGVQKGRRVNTVRVRFETATEIVQFALLENLDYRAGDKVKVIFDPAHPTHAYLFTFFTFWMRGLLLMLIPLFVWSAFSLSFMEKEDRLYLSFKGIRVVRAEERAAEMMKGKAATDIPFNYDLGPPPDDHNII
jgi:hypothetical protein